VNNDLEKMSAGQQHLKFNYRKSRNAKIRGLEGQTGCGS
jgi:hypothetical protein